MPAPSALQCWWHRMPASTRLVRSLPLFTFLLCLLLFTSSVNAVEAGAQASTRQDDRPGRANEATLSHAGHDIDHVRDYKAASRSQSIDGYTLGDVVLVSGIDGSLTALNRADGQVRWTISSSQAATADGNLGPPSSRLQSASAAFAPLIGTKYGKRRATLASILASASDGDEDDADENGFASGSHDGLPSRTRHLLNTVGMYVVEPGSSGTLYLLTSPKEGEGYASSAHHHGHGSEESSHTSDSRAHMQRLPLTLPQLVSLSPFSFPGDKGRVFTGSKHTKLLRIDPLSGQVDRTWETDGAEFGNFLQQSDDEQSAKWAYLARTDFTLSIALPRRPHLTQTLQYSTYTPQSSDADIATRWLQVYSDTGSRNHRSQPDTVGDGKVILPTGLDRDGRGATKLTSWNSTSKGIAQPAWTKDVPSQVVEVFDLLVPATDSQTHPVVVPHPPFALRGSGMMPSGSTGSFGGIGANDPDLDEDEEPEEETLLTFSPETGSLYALSSSRFPGVVRQVHTAWAGLDEGERETRSLVRGGTFHHPMQCRTFGCWLGRYRVQSAAREADSRGLLEAGMGRLGIGGGVVTGLPQRPDRLEISDQAANPERESGGRAANDSERQASPRPATSSRFSTKMLFTQAAGVFILACLTWLVRRGIREQSRLEHMRNEALVQHFGLQWSDAASAEAAASTANAPPQTTTHNLEAVSKDAAAADVPGIQQPEPPLRTEESAEAARKELLQAEAEKAQPANLRPAPAATNGSTGEGTVPDGAKKKKRRRGKRAGAAVKFRNAQYAEEGGPEGEESGKSDDEDAQAEKREINGANPNGHANDDAEAKSKTQSIAKSANKPKMSPKLPPASPVVLDAFDSTADVNGSARGSEWDGGWIKTGPGSKSAESQLVELAAMGSSQGYERIHSSSPLETSEEVLGFGSSGTVVVKGRFQNRVVAVKRLVVELVHLASQEISLLESADDHPNVIRYFYKEQRDKFLYIALELCPASLGDIVENPGQWKDLAVRLEPKKAVSQIASGLGHLHGLGIVHRDIKPPNILVAYANPHNPSTSSLKMLLSDFGLSKRIDSIGGQNSFSQTMHHPGGTAGWRAPEILRGDVNLNESGATTGSSATSWDAARLAAGPSSGASMTSSSSTTKKPRLTRAVDVFSFGCLAYYLLTSGDHPFGARYEREVNIIRGQCDTSRLAAFGEEGHEAEHLITSMIQADPARRPRAVQVLSHPYFWDAGKRLAFLQDVSDRLEVIDRERDKQIAVVKAQIQSGAGGSEDGSVATSFNGTVSSVPTMTHAAATAAAAAQVPESDVIRRLETGSKDVTEGGDWTRKVDKAFMDDLGKWRKYHGHSVRDLLRALRNKKHHYQDMPPALRRSMGSLPDGFLNYFTRRFPKLFLHVYEVIAAEGFIRSESTFEEYFAGADGE